VHYKDDVAGWAKYRQSKIVLQPKTPQTPITDEVLFHNFLHELIHFILYCAGEDGFDPPLHKREYLVDRIAGLLHQAIKTMRFD
jgi:predicted SprT family Zn-dependent metalloprotease